MNDSDAGGNPAPSDEELVQRSRRAPAGDLRAFSELMRRHEGRVLANCRYLTGSPTDAEDLTQEVMVKAYFGLEGFESRSSFTTWLHRIKVNHCLNFNAAQARRRHMRVEMPVVTPTAARVEAVGARRLIAAEIGADVREVLDAMPETLRVPLILRDMDGLSYQEIADALEIGLSAVKMRINRARKAFREQYLAPDPGQTHQEG